mmetsp:Transcript_1940/g.5623  ORF Transcript_1940/g.5623 Transcript_1940/m.5623 type:complete len:93 (+) Transcript_1940:70-348(+)
MALARLLRRFTENDEGKDRSDIVLVRWAANGRRPLPEEGAKNSWKCKSAATSFWCAGRRATAGPCRKMAPEIHDEEGLLCLAAETGSAECTW